MLERLVYVGEGVNLPAEGDGAGLACRLGFGLGGGVGRHQFQGLGVGLRGRVGVTGIALADHGRICDHTELVIGDTLHDLVGLVALVAHDDLDGVLSPGFSQTSSFSPTQTPGTDDTS